MLKELIMAVDGLGLSKDKSRGGIFNELELNGLGTAVFLAFSRPEELFLNL